MPALSSGHPFTQRVTEQTQATPPKPSVSAPSHPCPPSISYSPPSQRLDQSNSPTSARVNQPMPALSPPSYHLLPQPLPAIPVIKPPTSIPPSSLLGPSPPLSPKQQLWPPKVNPQKSLSAPVSPTASPPSSPRTEKAFGMHSKK